MISIDVLRLIKNGQHGGSNYSASVSEGQIKATIFTKHACSSSLKNRIRQRKKNNNSSSQMSCINVKLLTTAPSFSVFLLPGSLAYISPNSWFAKSKWRLFWKEYVTVLRCDFKVCVFFKLVQMFRNSTLTMTEKYSKLLENSRDCRSVSTDL